MTATPATRLARPRWWPGVAAWTVWALVMVACLVVAGATLAVAAVFHPVRRPIQAVVDRRFNRRRHDAAETIQAFSDRLRDQVVLDTLSAELLAVVEETMQPNQASLWLRPQASSTAVGRP